MSNKEEERNSHDRLELHHASFFMANLSDTLASVIIWLNIIAGIFLFLFGILGNCGNIYVFTRLVYRKTNAGIYLLAASISSIIQIIHVLLPRILSDGFQIPIVKSNVRYCQCRFIIAGMASLCAISYPCWASFDQYISTSRNANRRTRWSSKRFVCLSIVLTILFWFIFFLPGTIYSHATTNFCYINQRLISGIYSYGFVPFGYFFLPVILLLYFNIGIVKNLCDTPVLIVTNTNKRMARQVHRMLVPQLIILLVSGLPFISHTLYSAITESMVKDSDRLAIESLIGHITRLLFYLNFVSSFYVHMLTSSEFRKIIFERRACS